jgi:2-polyprenyl-6-methoxyphenol hydroxylase-like FAD-dependent oxidoreductase
MMTAEAMERPRPILVVGAGTTGLTMACELARHGAPVRIVDRLAEINPHCRATGLHSRTLEVFHDLGIVDEVRAAGTAFAFMNQYASGRLISRDPLGHVDSPYPFTISLEQWRTEAILERLLGRLGVTVERRTELVALAERPDGVSATLRHADGREETVDTPWLVGCDGAHSTVRHLTHQDFPGEEDPHQFVLADAVVEGPIAPDEGHAFLGDSGVLYMFPLPGGRMIVLATVDGHHDGTTETPALEEMQAIMAERGPAGTRVRDPRWLAYFRIHYRLARHYRHRRRVFLAGDAVHVHSPVGGQGMNTGVQDAYNLAWKLALVARGLAPDALLDSYEAERRAVAEDVITVTRILTERSEAFTHLSPAERDRLYLHVVVPEDRARQMAEHIEELDLDYRKSPICAERHGGRGAMAGPHTGAEIRDAGPLRQADRVFTLLDLLRGPRHTLLLFPGVRAGQAGWLRLARLAASTRRSHGALIDVHLVGATPGTGPADLPPGTSIVLDPERALHRRLGVRGESLYLIRPDGYIGYRSAPATPTSFRRYLERIFLPVADPPASASPGPVTFR